MISTGPFVLVIDLGTTSLRCSIVDSSGEVQAWLQSVVSENRDEQGLAWNGNDLAQMVLSHARELAAKWCVSGIAIANQRTTAMLWNAKTSEVIGPVISWSDGRTRELDRTIRSRGVPLTPGLSASKWRWLLDKYDPYGTLAKSGYLRVGTLDSWLVWILSGGEVHVTDHVNASHSGLFDQSQLNWDYDLVRSLDFASFLLPSLVSCTPEGIRATEIEGAPPILALIGDQQASLFGQGGHQKGRAKITFGTSAVLNMVLGDTPLTAPSRAAFGSIALSTQDEVLYGAEAAVMSAGSSLEWLIRLGVLSESTAIDRLVDPTRSSEAIFVPALDGIGVPHWKPNARGAFFGLSGAHGPVEMTRAVLDGIVAGTADIIGHMETVTGQKLETISIDGGLTRSATFRAILAASIDRPFYLASDSEATTRGAAALALRALGIDINHLFNKTELTVPEGTIPADHDAWRDAVTQVLNHTKKMNRL